MLNIYKIVFLYIKLNFFYIKFKNIVSCAIIQNNKVMSEEEILIPGIVYISTIPPGMKPISIRQILSQYGELGRVYLQAESKI